VHEDIYGYTPALYRDALAELERRGLAGSFDPKLLEQALTASAGMPFRVSPGPDSPSLADERASHEPNSTLPKRREPDRVPRFTDGVIRALALHFISPSLTPILPPETRMWLGSRIILRV